MASPGKPRRDIPQERSGIFFPTFGAIHVGEVQRRCREIRGQVDGLLQSRLGFSPLALVRIQGTEVVKGLRSIGIEQLHPYVFIDDRGKPLLVFRVPGRNRHTGEPARNGHANPLTGSASNGRSQSERISGGAVASASTAVRRTRGSRSCNSARIWRGPSGPSAGTARDIALARVDRRLGGVLEHLGEERARLSSPLSKALMPSAEADAER